LGIGDYIEVVKNEEKSKFNYDNYRVDIGMIAGGTGIAPMMQILQTLLHQENNLKFYIIFVNSTEADVPFKRLFSDFKDCYPEKFSFHWVLTKTSSSTWKNTTTGRMTPELFMKYLPSPQNTTQILYAGPPGFNDQVEVFLKQSGYSEEQIQKL